MNLFGVLAFISYILNCVAVQFSIVVGQIFDQYSNSMHELSHLIFNTFRCDGSFNLAKTCQEIKAFAYIYL